MSLLAEADRQFTICNACRYCEDYCVVFPAMERRSLFTEGDLSYLANVCHDCRACYQACMYTEPHEFAINIPALMAEARIASYERYARPRWLSRAFTAGPWSLALLTLASFAVLVALYALFGSLDALVHPPHGAGSFYDVVGHLAMAVPALLLTAYGTGALGLGFLAFWRDSGAPLRALANPRIWATMAKEAATLRWMRGGGAECYFPEAEEATPARRHMHSLVFYGFSATLMATITAFLDEWLLANEPPYPVLSVPVLLGLLGGVALVVGCIGLLALRMRADSRLTIDRSTALDVSFLVALLSVGVTGMLLLVVRDSGAMGVVLLIHLATVLALYITAPYGKLVHAVYRSGALLRSAHERAFGTLSAYPADG